MSKSKSANSNEKDQKLIISSLSDWENEVSNHQSSLKSLIKFSINFDNIIMDSIPKHIVPQHFLIQIDTIIDEFVPYLLEILIKFPHSSLNNQLISLLQCFISHFISFIC
jgi:hypothetical protein